MVFVLSVLELQHCNNCNTNMSKCQPCQAKTLSKHDIGAAIATPIFMITTVSQITDFFNL